MDNWADAVVGPDVSLRVGIAVVDKVGQQVALVVSPGGFLVGILTDGDIRRAVLAGKDLNTPVSAVMSKHPATTRVSATRDEMLSIMRARVIHHLPLLDGAGRLAGLATMSDLVGIADRPNWVVLMAGGLGVRLRPLTNEVPKPLLHVGGRPILETALQSFAEQGFRHIFLAVNYKSDMVRAHFGNGESWGVQVQYLQEPSQLGTAGSLSLLPSVPTDPLIVMNGDLLTRTDFGSLLAFHQAQGATATMAVRPYDVEVPYGVVSVDGTHITEIQEKPVHRHFINAGIYALSPDAIQHLPTDRSFDMPELFERLISLGRTAVAYLLRESWIDIGRLEELERARVEWEALRT